MRTSVSRCIHSTRFLAFAAAALLVTGVVLAAISGGVDDPNGVFQLDGNAVTDAAPFAAGTDDWDKVFAGTSHALATTCGNPTSNPPCTVGVVSDLTNTTSDNEFTGGGSKDVSGIQSGPWLWNTSKPQAKDDIAHAFAAAYTLPGVVNGAPTPCGGSGQPSCDTAIYFGMDRYDNSGDATAGFWFFQDSAIGLGGAKQGSGTHFTGQHLDGDILIVSDFSIGGSVSSITVYKWVGNDSTGSLQLQKSITTNATCNPATGTSPLCSIVNSGTIPSGGWGFKDKSGTPNNQMLPGEFLEGGINLNAIFGTSIPCISSFMAETRSSTSPTATLSDFSPPASFPLCRLNVSKSCSPASIVNGNQVKYPFEIDVHNAGVGPVYNVTLSDVPPSEAIVDPATGKIVNFTTTPDTSGGIKPGGVAKYFGYMITSAVLGTGDLNKVSATASSSSVSGADQNIPVAKADWGDPSTCGPVISPMLSISKLCETCLQSSSTSLFVEEKEGVQLCNSGNVNIAAITVQDCRDGNISGNTGSQTCSSGSFVTPSGWSSISLGAATIVNQQVVPTCTVLNATSNPTNLSDCSGGNCTFSDQVIASGTAALTPTSSSTVYANNGTPASTSCPICPIGTTCPDFTSSSPFK